LSSAATLLNDLDGSDSTRAFFEAGPGLLDEGASPFSVARPSAFRLIEAGLGLLIGVKDLLLEGACSALNCGALRDAGPGLRGSSGFSFSGLLRVEVNFWENKSSKALDFEEADLLPLSDVFTTDVFEVGSGPGESGSR
jgi:hypothetical protein